MRLRWLSAAFIAGTTVLGGGAAAALIAFAPGAGAATQLHININGIPIDIGPAVCLPGELFITGIGHDHVNDDQSANATVTGTATTVDANGNVLATGHGESWFGIQKASVPFGNDTTNVQINGVKIHMQGHFTVNGNGTVVVDRQTVTCG